MRLPSGDVRVVDLSVLVSERLPAAWPGHMPFHHRTWSYYAEIDQAVDAPRSLGPYRTNFLVMDEHCGTHFDGPTHFIPPPDSGLPWAGEQGTATGDTIALDRLAGPAVVIDVSGLAGQGAPGQSPFVEPALIERFERDHGALDAGDVVLFRTGWDAYYTEGPDASRYTVQPLTTRTAPGWPAPSPAAMLALHDRGVRLVGTDAPSMGAAHDGAEVHQEGLSRGMLYIELLTGLAALPPRGGYFLFLPMKLAGSTGGPGRAVAFLPAER